MGKDIHANNNPKGARVAILISNKSYLRQNCFKRQRRIYNDKNVKLLKIHKNYKHNFP